MYKLCDEGICCSVVMLFSFYTKEKLNNVTLNYGMDQEVEVILHWFSSPYKKEDRNKDLFPK
jgi:hypothetical protein